MEQEKKIVIKIRKDSPADKYIKRRQKEKAAFRELVESGALGPRISSEELKATRCPHYAYLV